jgi:hypothetical protein
MTMVTATATAAGMVKTMTVAVTQQLAAKVMIHV